jgi:Rieske Fe-S protein
VVAGAEPAAAAGKWVSVTNLTSLKVNVIRVFDPNNTNIRGLDRPVALTRHAHNVVTALDARCTHQGCTVGTKAGKSFVCPCHYSTFSGTGKRLGGAARTNLRPLKARVYKGKVQVFINPATF